LTLLAVTSFHAFGQECAPAVPCADKRGCPDLVVDPRWPPEILIRVIVFSNTDCAVIEGEAAPGTRPLLLFSTFTPNGQYILENEVNDTHFMTETDYSNNSAAITVQMRLFHLAHVWHPRQRSSHRPGGFLRLPAC
jgi:hypothetical protein